jgi:hypothetical protein
LERRLHVSSNTHVTRAIVVKLTLRHHFSFAEMISGVPIFRGRDNTDQLNQIIRVIGTPDDRVMRKIMQDSVSGIYRCANASWIGSD